MRTTIGELVAELSLYSNLIEMNISSGFPFLRIYLSGRNNTTKAIMYVIQTSEHQYAAYDNEDDLLGNKCFPTGSISRPFIREDVLAKELFGDNIESYKLSIKNNMNYNDFIDYLYTRLWQYDIIKFDPKNKRLHFAGMGFTSTKIRNIINSTFSKNNHPNGKISDLFDIVIKDRKPFDLDDMKPKELKCVYATLKNIGIVPLIKDNKIIEIDFERRI